MKKLVMDTFYIKLAFILLGLFTSVPFIYKYISSGMKFFLIWSVLVLFFIVKNSWKSYMKIEYLLLILFLGAYGITILVNLGPNTISEILLLSYMVTYLLALTYYDSKKSEEAVRKEIHIFFYIIVFITMIYAAVCVVMFVFSIDGSFRLRDIDFPYGVYENRLWGLYNPNTGAVFNYLSVILSTILLDKIKKKTLTVLLWINIILQAICFVLAQSRGAQLAFFAYLFFYFLFIKDSKFKTSKLKDILFRFAMLVCTIVIIFGAGEVALWGLSYVPESIANSGYSQGSTNHGGTLRRNPTGNTFESETSGRAGLWEMGIDTFIEHPAFGTGAESIDENMKEHFSHERYLSSKGGGLHNVYITALSSCGAVGAIMIFAFFALFCIRCLRYIIKKENSVLCKQLIAIIFAFLAGDMVETRILFTTSFLSIIFWIFVGCVMYYMNADKKGKVMINE